MYTHAAIKILLGTIIVFSALLLSIKNIGLSFKNGVTISVQSAYAKVGKPLSAGSVAGVHRRQKRRE